MVGAWEPCQRGLNLDILWLGVCFLLWYMKLKIDDITHGKTKLSTGSMSWHTAMYRVVLTGQNKVVREALTCDFTWNAFLINAWSQIVCHTTWWASFNKWIIWKSSISLNLHLQTWQKDDNQSTGTVFLVRSDLSTPQFNCLSWENDKEKMK